MCERNVVRYASEGRGTFAREEHEMVTWTRGDALQEFVLTYVHRMGAREQHTHAVYIVTLFQLYMVGGAPFQRYMYKGMVGD